jgi:anti-sigma regulatory factor (Ser/Thr protein kinase)
VVSPGSAPAGRRWQGGPSSGSGDGSPFAALPDSPSQSYLELGALPGAVPCARLHARQVAWEWGFQELVDSVEVIVSELVTNALHASEGLIGSRYAGRWAPGVPPVRLWLQAEGKRVVIQVWDGNDKLPIRQTASPSAEGGRGLLLVESISTSWGSYQAEGSSGKVVWAVVGSLTAS